MKTDSLVFLHCHFNEKVCQTNKTKVGLYIKKRKMCAVETGKAPVASMFANAKLTQQELPGREQPNYLRLKKSQNIQCLILFGYKAQSVISLS